MKHVIFAVTLIACMNIHAQNVKVKSNGFVRVYNLQGKKIGKGKIHKVSETSLQLFRHGETMEFMVDDIGRIKTKRSGGNNVLVGAATGATAFAIVGIATADPDAWIFGYNRGEGALSGAIFGGTAGAAIGGISILFKNSKSFEINGDSEKWKGFTEHLTFQESDSK